MDYKNKYIKYKHKYINLKKSLAINNSVSNIKPNINSVVILINGNIERSNNVDEQKSKLGNIPLNIFDAIDGSKLDLDKLKNDEGVNKWIIEDTPKRKGQIGCYLSHRAVIKNILNDNYNDYTLILEDDFVIECENLEEEINKIINKLEKIGKNDYDIIFLGLLLEHNKYKIIDNIYIPTKNLPVWGLQGYLIKNSSANKIYNMIKNITTSIDGRIDELIKNNKLKVCIINPSIITQKTQTSGHPSQNIGTMKSLVNIS